MKNFYGRSGVLAGILALFGLVAWLHWSLLPAVPHNGLLRVGGIAELLGWMLLLVWLIGTQIWELPSRIRQILTVGLTLWLVAMTADVMDEIRVQPLWLSVYFEDVTRLLGMFVVTVGLIWLLRHVSNTMQELERLGLIDPLTGLSNRRMFRQSVLARSEPGFSLMLMDLDHFKRVNDRHGHDVGDDVLCQVADALRQLRPDQSEVFRLGGEEFAIVSNPLSEDQLLAMAEQIRSGIAELEMTPAMELTLSAGVGSLGHSERTMELMRRVDQALYRAKDSGRNQVMMAHAKPATQAA